MEYTASDFERLKYNVMVEGDVLEKIPALKKFQSFAECNSENRNELIRYVVLMYDKRSPIVSSSRSPEAKHLEALSLSGLQRLGDPSEDIINMAIDLLKDQNDLVWALIVANEGTFWEYQRMVAEPVTSFDGDKDRLSATSLKTKLLKDCDEIAARLEAYYMKVFQDQKTVEKAKIRLLTPENIAKNA